MNSQYNIVIQWSGDKVFFWNFPAAGLYMSNPFKSIPVVASSLVLSIASAFSLRVSPDWHWVLSILPLAC